MGNEEGEVSYWRLALVINLALFLLATAGSFYLPDIIGPPVVDGSFTLWQEVHDQVYTYISFIRKFFFYLTEAFWGGMLVFYICLILGLSFEKVIDESTVAALVFLVVVGIVFIAVGLVWTSWMRTATPSVYYFVTGSYGDYPGRTRCWVWYVISAVAAAVLSWIFSGWINGAIKFFRKQT